MKYNFAILLCLILILFSTSQTFAKKIKAPEWKSEGCDIVKEDLELAPQKLFEEFIKRDSEAEFLQSSPWLNKAVMCPGYMGGPDTFYVISDKKIKALGKNKFRVSYSIEGSVTAEKIGDQSFSVFKSEKKKVDEEYRVVKTPWGWKLADPWSASRVLPDQTLNWIEKSQTPFDQKSIDLITNIKTKTSKD